jgi:hypothetical protein
MLLLLTTALSSLPDSPYLGRLLQPRHQSRAAATDARGITWAADNDCFQGLDVDAYLAMLERLAPVAGATFDRREGRVVDHWRRSGCRFVTVPDVVGDPVATARLWRRWAPGLRRRGLPLAFVAQDGCERHWTPPLHEFDCLFIGGSTEYKLGPTVEQLIRVAKAHGKWVHCGRVNSEKRLRYAAEIGCDSVDGTGWLLWRDANLPRALRVLEEINERPRQLRLVA